MPDNGPSFDGARVLADLNALRAIGAYKTGVHKPTFSEPHKQSLEWLVQKLPDASLSAAVDGIGNVFGTSTKPGPKLLAGSHLESQNYAGWLDGPLGVVYALEAARVLNADPSVNGAVEVAAWCDEEGHFGSFLGSRSYVGQVTEADIDAARDRTNGRPMRAALADMGLAGRPRVAAEKGRHVGYLEAHIEQGDTLESGQLAIGVVTSIVGIWQYRINFVGEQNHAGTTRMAARKDAGLALAKFCVAIDERFPGACGPRTVWTTGRITLDPGAPSISGWRRNAVPDPRRQPGGHRAAGGIAEGHGGRGQRQRPLRRDRGEAADRCSRLNELRLSGRDRSCEQGCRRRTIHPHAQRRRPRRADARDHHARGDAVRAVDRRHQPSLDREHRGRRHRHWRAGLRRRLPANPRWLGL
ncbi:acetylornithine deacetylase/succinyl-diaminopimelate desuccinylase-like protein [Bradyrhizobium diazoefficiens]